MVVFKHIFSVLWVLITVYLFLGLCYGIITLILEGDYRTILIGGVPWLSVIVLLVWGYLVFIKYTGVLAQYKTWLKKLTDYVKGK